MAERLTRSYREWFAVELNGSYTDRFSEYCRDMHINFETSKCGYGYTHFEVLLNNEELDEANKFLDTLD